MKSAIITTKLKQAIDAFDGRNYAIAHPIFLQAAQQKSTIAQFHLGKMYEQGLGVNQDYVQAANYFRQAAERGYPPAQAKLGEFYANGLGLPMDYRQAAEWFSKAADQQDKTPEHRLHEACSAYEVEDFDTALSTFQELAQENDAVAQFHLGEMYSAGKGVPTDFQQAADWYELAAKQDFVPAQVRLGRMFANGEGVQKDYRAAAEWLMKAAEREDDDNENLFEQAQNAYRQNDYANAFNMLEKLANRNHDAAQYYLGSMYKYGYSVRQDNEQAIEWYMKSAKQGYSDAVAMVRELASKHSMPLAMFGLGELYGSALGVEQDDVQAADWFLRAAQRGYVPAQIKMAEWYGTRLFASIGLVWQSSTSTSCRTGTTSV